MDTLLRGLRYSKYAVLREVVENEFADEVPEKKRDAFIRKLLPPVGNVFSAYDLSYDNFALSPEYDLLYTELTEPRIHGSVPFGGSYRMVDFILSGMVNAGIRDVGVISFA